MLCGYSIQADALRGLQGGEPMIHVGEGRPWVPHEIGTMISPLHVLALDSDVCPTLVACPVDRLTRTITRF